MNAIQLRTLWQRLKIDSRSAGFLALASCLGCQQAAPLPKLPTRSTAVERESLPADTVAAQEREWPVTVRVQGSLLGDEHAVVGAHVAGRVKRVLVDLGSTVQKGDVLAELDSEDFDLRVRQAEANIEQARARLGLKPNEPVEQLVRADSPTVLQEKAVLEEAQDLYDRAETLYRQNTITAAEFQQREAKLRVAEAKYNASLIAVDEQLAQLAVRQTELAVVRQQQSETIIRAPFTATVQQRLVAPGVYVQVGQAAVSLVRTDPLRFQASVPQRSAMRVQVGQSVQVILEGLDHPIAGRVDRVSPSLDLASRSLLLEVDVPNAGSKLRAGLFAEADILIDQHARTIAVPASAVVEFAGVEKVRVIENGQPHERRIVTGRRSADWVEVLDGLSVGQPIAVQRRRTAESEVANSTESSESPASQSHPGVSE